MNKIDVGIIRYDLHAVYCGALTDRQDADVFIGTLLGCDQPDVFITVIKAQKGKCKFEINNHTHEELLAPCGRQRGLTLWADSRGGSLWHPAASDRLQ